MNPKSCTIIELPKINDPRGNLSFIESERHIPFEIKRVFYLYNVPVGETRAGHALKQCHQFIIAISGSFDLILDDGTGKKRYQLNQPYRGLYVPPMIWREINNFSSNAVCLVLASEYYNEADYFREYGEFIKVIEGQSK
jgi:dTDP-4-dehydrorhamnose 3,5-epimerase-like enzyme